MDENISPHEYHSTPMFWPIKNQLKRMTCAAFGVAAVAEWQLLDQARAAGRSLSFPLLSEQFLFWAAKVIDAIPTMPGPTYLKSTATAIGNPGVCDDHHWPYAENPLNPTHDPTTHAGLPHLTPPPSISAQAAAAQQQWTMKYTPSPKAQDVKDAFDQYGAVALSLPVKGVTPRRELIDVWDNEFTPLTGILLPVPATWSPTGMGHTVCVINVISEPKAPGGFYFLFRNSWDPSLWATSPPSLVGGVPVPPGHGRVSWQFVDKFARSMAHWIHPAKQVATTVPTQPVSTA